MRLQLCVVYYRFFVFPGKFLSVGLNLGHEFRHETVDMKCLLTPLLISFCFFNCVQAYRGKFIIYLLSKKIHNICVFRLGINTALNFSLNVRFHRFTDFKIHFSRRKGKIINLIS